jgi:hypothetical protein
MISIDPRTAKSNAVSASRGLIIRPIKNLHINRISPDVSIDVTWWNRFN